MGLLDALLNTDTGGGLLGGLPSSWQYPTSAPDAGEEKKRQDAAFLAAINQDPYQGVSNPAATPIMSAQPQFGGGAPLPGVMGGSMPFGLGGINLPQQQVSTGAPASGLFPAVPYMPAQAAPQPAIPPQTPQPAAAPTPQGQPGPINTMNIGGYQMPQYGTAADYTPQPQAIPPQVANAQAQDTQDQPQQLPPAFGEGYLNRVHAGGGLIRSLFSATPQQQNLKAQYDAIRQTLLANGDDPQKASSKAMLAVMSPEAGKTILNEALPNKEQFKTITDAMGNQVPIFVNERDQTINGKPIGAEGSSPAAGGGFLATGVKQIDSSLTGQDYLDQFSPEVKAAVQNYVDGKSMPTGNPRKGFTQTVKMIAQKYGSDTGQSVDDATYAARRTMRNQLSSSAPSSLGGQINIGNTAAGHLADLTQKAVELGNVDTGIAPLTSIVNSARGLGTEQAAKMEALKGAAQHYGQEITKFYAGSPGGTAERDRFIESVNGARSPKELAAILSTEGELMRSRLDALGGQIKGVLGDEGLKQYPVLRPDGQAALSKVEQNVSRLRGGQPAQAAAPTIQEGATATNPKTGQKITFINGKWQ